MSTQPIKITWTGYEETQCVMLGARGMSTRMICEQTGLTPCQVSYRLKKSNVRRSDYRDGHSAEAQNTLSRTRSMSDKQIRAALNLRIIK